MLQMYGVYYMVYVITLGLYKNLVAPVSIGTLFSMRLSSNLLQMRHLGQVQFYVILSFHIYITQNKSSYKIGMHFDVSYTSLIFYPTTTLSIQLPLA